MYMVWLFEPTWTPEGGPVRPHSRVLQDIPGYPNATVLKTVQTHRRPLQLGERPVVHHFAGEPSAETETPRGRGLLVWRGRTKRRSSTGV